MNNFRCYVPNFTADSQNNIRLDISESRHLITVRRARAGDPVTVFNGTGQIANCTIKEANPKAATLSVVQTETLPKPSVSIVLAQALIKSKGMDMIIQKASELGIDKIIPLKTQNSEIQIDPKRIESKRTKWQQTAIEACKQSGNPHLPTIAPAEEFTSFVTSSESQWKFIASLEKDAMEIHETFAQNTPALTNDINEIICLVGPEGDFTPEEYQLAYANNFHPTHLGSTILRSETAALALITIISYELRKHS